jgi:hypothetical protein
MSETKQAACCGGTLLWLARISSVVVAGVFFLLLAGEVIFPHSGPPQRWQEWAGIALVTAACAAMLAAWKWKFPGATVSLACLAAFASVVRLNDYTVIGLAAVPAILYLADWVCCRLRPAAT